MRIDRRRFRGNAVARVGLGLLLFAGAAGMIGCAPSSEGIGPMPKLCDRCTTSAECGPGLSCVTFNDGIKRCGGPELTKCNP